MPRLDALNLLDREAAEREFLRCCGSKTWARSMAAAGPFAGVEALRVSSDLAFTALAPADWLEAFAAHPRIGASGAAGAGQAGGAGRWSAAEQSGVRSASDAIRDRLERANREYEARFGYTFIVCATGRSAEEMLAMLERRLTHDPDDELRVAAGEQRAIARLRLAKLVDAEGSPA